MNTKSTPATSRLSRNIKPSLSGSSFQLAFVLNCQTRKQSASTMPEAKTVWKGRMLISRMISASAPLM
ncbi:MAG: hypothetical protein M5U26_00965 [Planctomycetota bacterium]|nr:hypothetical protein [Planctomycetota bacterium]